MVLRVHPPRDSMQHSFLVLTLNVDGHIREGVEELNAYLRNHPDRRNFLRLEGLTWDHTGDFITVLCESISEM
jgi:hypothetical protein